MIPKICLVLIRVLVFLWGLGLIYLLYAKIANISNKSGKSFISSLFLFPFLIWTKKGRKILNKSIK